MSLLTNGASRFPSPCLQLEAKTRKLKKVWHKLQGAQQEIRDLGEEFQKEREDMLDTIRELNKQLKLKQLLLEAFVPLQDIERVSGQLAASPIAPAPVRRVSYTCFASPLRSPLGLPLVQLESRAIWDEAADEWNIMRFELAGNRMRVRRPPSILTSAHETLFGAAPMADMRPMSQYGITSAAADMNEPRYRADNIANFELEYMDGGAQAYNAAAGKLGVSGSVRAVMEAPSMVSGAGKDVGGAGAEPAPSKGAPIGAGAGPARESGRAKSSNKRG